MNDLAMELDPNSKAWSYEDDDLSVIVWHPYGQRDNWQVEVQFCYYVPRPVAYDDLGEEVGDWRHSVMRDGGLTKSLSVAVDAVLAELDHRVPGGFPLKDKVRHLVSARRPLKHESQATFVDKASNADITQEDR